MIAMGVITASRFKTIVIHTALNGAVDSMIYELVDPCSFAEAQHVLNKSNSVFALVTTEGVVGISTQAVSGFELHDPVINE